MVERVDGANQPVNPLVNQNNMRLRGEIEKSLTAVQKYRREAEKIAAYGYTRYPNGAYSSLELAQWAGQKLQTSWAIQGYTILKNHINTWELRVRYGWWKIIDTRV